MCTGIKIDYEDGCIIGRTMDFEVPVNYNAIYLPRDYNYAEDLMGNQLYTKYKMMGMSFENKTPLKDGVNEHGLIGITNTFTSFNLYDKGVNPEKINIAALDFFNYVLGNYKTVEELVRNLGDFHISTKNHKGEKVSSPDFHFMFSDPTKRCVVVEAKKGKLTYHDNPYGVITNSPGLEAQAKRLNRVLDINKLDSFNSVKDLPGGYDPYSRFIKAFYLKESNVKSNNSQQAFSNFYNIIGTMVMPEGFVKNKKHDEMTYTRYICAYDTKDRLLTIKFHSNPTVYQLGFEDIDDENRRQEFFIDPSFVFQKLNNKTNNRINLD